jgi:hypothetical protein
MLTLSTPRAILVLTPFTSEVLVLKRLWQTSPELTATALLMLAALAGAGIGLVLDPRTITGAPAWLKPAKFAASIAIYSLTLAWIFTLLPDWRRTRRIVGWVTAVTLVLEMIIISAQAWRGTASHFNVATPLDAVLFTVMGVAIFVQTLASITVATALWRQHFGDAALGWALRMGMTLTIVGAFTGGLMTRPTSAQLAAARAGERLTIAGAHTVGAPDGGPGLIGSGWSTEHGDLRVAHFVGLHAVQVLPIVAMVFARFAALGRVRTRLTIVAAASYLTLYVILLSQALRGVPLVAPDATSVAQLIGWATGTAMAALLVTLRAYPERHTAAV